MGTFPSPSVETFTIVVFVTSQDEESLNSKLCTFTVTQKEFMNQHWYHCHTCKLVDGVGMCSICAKVCHKVSKSERPGNLHLCLFAEELSLLTSSLC